MHERAARRSDRQIGGSADIALITSARDIKVASATRALEFLTAGSPSSSPSLSLSLSLSLSRSGFGDYRDYRARDIRRARYEKSLRDNNHAGGKR